VRKVSCNHNIMMLLLTGLLGAPSTGNPACPCIDIWASKYALVLNGNAPADDATAGCDMRSSIDGACFSADYGASACAAHDKDTAECSEGSPPDWCSSTWCYVDIRTCDRPTTTSSYFDEVQIMTATTGSGDDSCPESTNLTFSYQTCGGLDAYSASISGSALHLQKYATSRPNGRLRVSFPGDSASSYTLVGLKAYPDGSAKVPINGGIGGTNRSGSVIAFMANLMDQAGVLWQEVPISDDSYAYSTSSSFTACVHEVAIGNTDMCWANFWPTVERMVLTQFTTSMYGDDFFLIVRAGKEDTTLLDTIGQPFEPFSLDLWIAIVAVFGIVGVLAALDNKPEEESAWDFFLRLPFAYFDGVNAYNSGGLEGEKRTSGSWVINIFVGFTVMVLGTGYGAVVTSTLISESATAVSNLDEAIAAGYTFCCNSASVSLLSAAHPQLANLLVPLSLGESLNGVDEGLCNAAILSGDEGRSARLFGEEAHCEGAPDAKVRLPTTVATFPNANPVRPEIAGSISALMMKSLLAGKYEELVTDARLNYTYGECPEADDVSEVEKFALHELGGPLLFMLVVSILSFASTRCGRAMHRRANKVKARRPPVASHRDAPKSDETVPDGSTTVAVATAASTHVVTADLGIKLEVDAAPAWPVSTSSGTELHDQVERLQATLLKRLEEVEKSVLLHRIGRTKVRRSVKRSASGAVNVGHDDGFGADEN